MNIIEKTMIMDYNTKACILVSLFIAIIFFTVFFMDLFNKFPKKLFLPSMAICSTLLIFLGPISGQLFETESGRYKYLAELDDSITINEIYENYENISRNDDGRYYFEDRK